MSMSSASDFWSKLHRLFVNTQQSLDSVKYWMLTNKIQFNEGKTIEVILIVSKHFSKHLPPSISLTFSGSIIVLSYAFKNLGVILDTWLSLKKIMLTVCNSIFLEPRRSSYIRHPLTIASTRHLLGIYIVQTRLLYSLMSITAYSTSSRELKTMLLALYSASGRMMTSHHFYDLHWLPLASH